MRSWSVVTLGVEVAERGVAGQGVGAEVRRAGEAGAVDDVALDQVVEGDAAARSASSASTTYPPLQ